MAKIKLSCRESVAYRDGADAQLYMRKANSVE